MRHVPGEAPGAPARPTGWAENIVAQFGAPRCVFGWIDGAIGCQYLVFYAPGRRYLFKIVYRYPRPDAVGRNQDAVGFLAEIVYGPNRELAALSVPRDRLPCSIMLDGRFSVLGEIPSHKIVMDDLFAERR
jgi:hypothetical protein